MAQQPDPVTPVPPPESLQLAGEQHRLVPGQIVLEFNRAVDDEDVAALLAGLEYTLRPIERPGTRRAARGRVFWLRVGQIEDAGADPEAVAAWIRKLVSDNQGLLRRGAPVYARDPGDLSGAVAPVPDRLVLRTEGEREDDIRRWADERGLAVRDITFGLLDETQLGALITRAGRDAREAFERLRDRRAWLLREPGYRAAGYGALPGALALGDSAALDVRTLDGWLESSAGTLNATTYWNLVETGLEQLRAGSADGAGVVVAVLDSGFDLQHPALAGQFVDSSLHYNTEEALDLGLTAGFDASTAGEGHGTGIASIIAGKRLASHPVRGIAPGCRVLPVRMGAAPSAVELGCGLLWAAAKGARVANLSLETIELGIVADQVSLAARCGMLLVAAAGNRGLADSSPALPFPARHVDVLAVGAAGHDAVRRAPSFAGDWGSQFASASTHPQVDVLAPGIDCVAADDSVGGYVAGDVITDAAATSVATAHVTGLAALLFASDPRLAARQVRRGIERGARLAPAYQGQGWFDSAGHERHLHAGYGFIDGTAALQQALAVLDTPEPVEHPKGGPVAANGVIRTDSDAISTTAGELYSAAEQALVDQLIAAVDGGDARGIHGALYTSRVKTVINAEGDAEEQHDGGRLYLDGDLTEWIDIPAEAVVQVHRDETAGAPFGRFTVWVTASARLTHSRKAGVADFLDGEVLRANAGAGMRSDGMLLELLRAALAGGGGPAGGFDSMRGPCRSGGYQSMRGPC